MKRARRAGLRASRTLRRLPLRGKLILGGALTLFVAFMIAGAVLLSRGGNAKAAEQARDVNVGGVAAGEEASASACDDESVSGVRRRGTAGGNEFL